MLNEVYIADDVHDYKEACLMKDSSEHPNTFIIFHLTVVVNNIVYTNKYK